MDKVHFVLSKLVGALIRADTWLVIALLAILLALMAGRIRLATGIAAGTFTAMLALAILPLGDMLLRPLERAYPADPPLGSVDGIVILGGATNQSASLFWQQPQISEAGDRMTAGFSLARRFPDAKVIFTGGSGRIRDLGQVAETEASVAQQIFGALGLEKGRVIYEDRSRNTADNARFSLPLAQPKDGEVWLLVTSAYHMPRSMARFEAAGWTGLVAWPVDYLGKSFTDGIGWNLTRNLYVLNVGIKEIVGLLALRAGL